MMTLPALFVSHGAPTLVLEDIPARDFLKGLGAAVGKPTAVLAVSAHWETDAPALSTVERPETIHDFYGFPEALYRLSYPAPGAPALADEAAKLLKEAGLAATMAPSRGLDHGAWVPLMLMYPEADIPVTQLSIQPHLGPAHHLAVGRALAPLRSQNVLILGSGGAIHNLRALAWREHDAPPAWAADFDRWLADHAETGDAEALVAYRKMAPNAEHAHPRDEHFMPFFVALGAGGKGAKGKRLHASFAHGSLSMAAFSFS